MRYGKGTWRGNALESKVKERWLAGYGSVNVR